MDNFSDNSSSDESEYSDDTGIQEPDICDYINMDTSYLD